ncbi:MAG: type II toxin-antitoxin system VapC family toxin [Ornithinimicrobium sp.]|uniref:type II toxin-antitoxin system VapC family toxin n=1 Tax=Ornithinimicrobium sp. TaxID=1977084 RepID=UPI0017DFDF09|nr:PIN domain-containing protein [Actinomycetota bacterium]
MIVLDASVLIAFLDGQDAHHAAAEQLLSSAVDEDLAVNSLTLAEVLVAPVREGRLDAIRAALDDLEIKELPFPADAAVKLATLRAATGLKMPDCCVVLAADDAPAGIGTFDDRLAQVAEERGLTVVQR